MCSSVCCDIIFSCPLIDKNVIFRINFTFSKSIHPYSCLYLTTANVICHYSEQDINECLGIKLTSNSSHFPQDLSPKCCLLLICEDSFIFLRWSKMVHGPVLGPRP